MNSDKQHDLVRTSSNKDASVTSLLLEEDPQLGMAPQKLSLIVRSWKVVFAIVALVGAYLSRVQYTAEIVMYMYMDSI